MPKDRITKHNKFDKDFSNYVLENNIHAVCFVSRGDQEIVIGEKKLVNVVKGNPKITSEELKRKMKEFTENQGDDEKLEVEVYRGPLLFPKLPVKLGSKSWDSETSRKYLLAVFNILGFGKNSFLNYKSAEHMPEGFPSDVISWSKFGERGPRGSRIDECTLIVKSLFKHHMGMSEAELMTYYKGCPESPSIEYKEPEVEENEDIMERVDSEELAYREYLANESSNLNFSQSSDSAEASEPIEVDQVFPDDHPGDDIREDPGDDNPGDCPGDANTGDYPGDDDHLEGLCEYEVIRMKNIMERQAMFQSLDMEDAKLELTPSRPKHVPSSRGDCPEDDNTGDDHLGDNSDDYSDLRQITTPTIPSYQGTPCIQFLRQGQKRRVDKEDSDVETTTDEETEVELEKNFKIDTEDEFDLADFSDEEDKTLQASARLLSAGEKARDKIMQWTDKDLDMDGSE